MRDNVLVPIKLGVVSTIRKPLQFQTWLDHHRGIASRFYIFATEGDDIRAPDVVVDYRPDKPFAYDFWNVQEANVNKCIERAKGDGITHLIHIDDDELIHVPDPSGLLKELQSTSDACLIMKNLEGRLHSLEVSNPFDECIFFTNTNYKSYVNGKSIGNLTAGARAAGAHRFVSDEGGETVLKTATILHYEGLSKQRYFEKMKRYRARGGAAQCDAGTIPFESYCTAIRSSSAVDMDAAWVASHLASSADCLRCIHRRFKTSVCLVGNGPSAIDKGQFIDACDSVVRFNEFVLANNVGAKCDVWCVSDHVAHTTDAWKAHDHPLIIVSNSIYARDDFPNSCATVYDARREFTTTGAGWMSTGALALNYMLRTQPDALLVLVGFDHFQSKLHHYDDEVIGPLQHDCLREREFVERIIAESAGRVFRL